MPALRATRSPFSCCGCITSVSAEGVLLGARRVGDALRVDGAVGMSMSIMIDDCRRMAGSRAKRVASGLGGCRIIGDSRTAVDGLSKDHVRTRSRAKA